MFCGLYKKIWWVSSHCLAAVLIQVPAAHNDMGSHIVNWLDIAGFPAIPPPKKTVLLWK